MVQFSRLDISWALVQPYEMIKYSTFMAVERKWSGARGESRLNLEAAWLLMGDDLNCLRDWPALDFSATSAASKVNYPALQGRD
ncbi:hypothetical protein D3C77_370820 [compost metagenome]